MKKITSCLLIIVMSLFQIHPEEALAESRLLNEARVISSRPIKTAQIEPNSVETPSPVNPLIARTLSKASQESKRNVTITSTETTAQPVAIKSTQSTLVPSPTHPATVKETPGGKNIPTDKPIAPAPRDYALGELMVRFKDETKSFLGDVVDWFSKSAETVKDGWGNLKEGAKQMTELLWNLGVKTIDKLFPSSGDSEINSGRGTLDQIAMLKFKNENQELTDSIASLESSGFVEYAEKNGLYLLDTQKQNVSPLINLNIVETENDPDLEDLLKRDLSSLWGLQTINVKDAWMEFDLNENGRFDQGEIRPGEGVTVAVIDTGIYYNHPDLFDNIWVNAQEISYAVGDKNGDGIISWMDADFNQDGRVSLRDIDGLSQSSEGTIVWNKQNQDGQVSEAELKAVSNGQDDDGNNKNDDVMGWNFHPANNDIHDIDQHGTHVSGTIAARGSVKGSVIGVAPWAQVMALNVFQIISFDPSFGIRVGAAQSDIINAIYYAVDQGAKVINLSLAGAGKVNSDPYKAYNDVVNFARQKGVTVAVAAGNNAENAQDQTPANVENAITVTAVEPDGSAADFTNFGYLSEIAAPGVGILSTIRNHQYASLSGTSMASPHVAGAAALLLSKHAHLSPDQVKQTLVQSTDPYLSSEYLGTGILNAAKAIQNPVSQLADGKIALAHGQDLLKDKVEIPIELHDASTYRIELGYRTSPLNDFPASRPTDWILLEEGKVSTPDFTRTVTANLSAYDISPNVISVIKLTAQDREGRFFNTTKDIYLTPTIPFEADLKINQGAEKSNSLQVMLSMHLSALDSKGYQMCFSNDGVSWSDWENYQSQKSWKLAESATPNKLVSMQIKDPRGKIRMFSDTILYEVKQNLALKSGWNLVSFYIQSDKKIEQIKAENQLDPSVTFWEIMGDHPEQAQRVQMEETETLKGGKGYWIYNPKNDQSIELSGGALISKIALSRPGWHFIGSFQENVSLDQIDFIRPNYSSTDVSELQLRDAEGKVAEKIEAAKAYWIYVPSEGDLWLPLSRANISVGDQNLNVHKLSSKGDYSIRWKDIIYYAREASSSSSGLKLAPMVIPDIGSLVPSFDLTDQLQNLTHFNNRWQKMYYFIAGSQPDEKILDLVRFCDTRFNGQCYDQYRFNRLEGSLEFFNRNQTTIGEETALQLLSKKYFYDSKKMLALDYRPGQLYVRGDAAPPSEIFLEYGYLPDLSNKGPSTLNFITYRGRTGETYSMLVRGEDDLRDADWSQKSNWSFDYIQSQLKNDVLVSETIHSSIPEVLFSEGRWTVHGWVNGKAAFTEDAYSVGSLSTRIVDGKTILEVPDRLGRDWVFELKTETTGKTTFEFKQIKNIRAELVIKVNTEIKLRLFEDGTYALFDGRIYRPDSSGWMTFSDPYDRDTTTKVRITFSQDGNVTEMIHVQQKVQASSPDYKKTVTTRTLFDHQMGVQKPIEIITETVTIHDVLVWDKILTTSSMDYRSGILNTREEYTSSSREGLGIRTSRIIFANRDGLEKKISYSKGAFVVTGTADDQSEYLSIEDSEDGKRRIGYLQFEKDAMNELQAGSPQWHHYLAANDFDLENVDWSLIPKRDLPVLRSLLKDDFIVSQQTDLTFNDSEIVRGHFGNTVSSHQVWVTLQLKGGREKGFLAELRPDGKLSLRVDEFGRKSKIFEGALVDTGVQWRSTSELAVLAEYQFPQMRDLDFQKMEDGYLVLKKSPLLNLPPKQMVIDLGSDGSFTPIFDDEHNLIRFHSVHKVVPTEAYGKAVTADLYFAPVTSGLNPVTQVLQKEYRPSFLDLNYEKERGVEVRSLMDMSLDSETNFFHFSTNPYAINPYDSLLQPTHFLDAYYDHGTLTQMIHEDGLGGKYGYFQIGDLDIANVDWTKETELNHELLLQKMGNDKLLLLHDSTYKIKEVHLNRIIFTLGNKDYIAQADANGKVVAVGPRDGNILQQYEVKIDDQGILKLIPGSKIYYVEQGQSIQAVMEQAQFGDTVHLLPGEYRGSFALKEGVNLIGEDPKTTTIHGNFQNQANVITAKGNNRIEGLTITGGGAYAGVPSSALRIEGANVEVKNNRFVDNQDYAINVVTRGSVTIENNLFWKNQLGIQLSNGAAFIRRNTFVQNAIGVNILHGGQTTVEENIFTDHGFQAIYEYWDGRNPSRGYAVIRNNSFFRNQAKEGFSAVTTPPSVETQTDGNRFEDPLFRNALAGDFSLKESSPSLGRGR